MELQFNKKVCRHLHTAVREIQNQELTQEVRLTDGMPDIGRTLASWGQVVIRSKEWRGDMIAVSGGVMVWILYVPEDGSEPRTVDTWLPFQMRWNLADTDREGPICISPLLRFVDSRTVSARKMMVRVGIAAMAEAFCPMETDVFCADELPDDIEVLRRTYPVQLQKEAGEKTFLLDEDLTVPGSAVTPEKLLCYTVHPEVTDCRVLGNKLVFRGSGNLHLVYRGQDGRIHICDFDLPFSQFTELDGSYGSDALGCVRMAVTNLELDLDDQGQLRLKCGMVGQYTVRDRELLELTEDAYSPRRAVDVAMDDLFLPTVLESRTETVTAEQMLTGSSGEIVDVGFLPDFPRQHQTAEGISMEIPGLFQVLYYGEDGSLQCGNARWEGNLTMPAGADSSMNVLVMPTGQPMGVTGTEGYKLSGQVQMLMETTAGQGIPMATGIETGEILEPDPGRPSLILCRPGNEGLWHLAKRCGSTMSAIQKANGLDGEPTADRLLLIPVS